MEYACPVCEVPQSDDEHLANHLAFTAMLHGDEHEAWLDEHVPEWGDLNPDSLAERVVEFADEAAADEALHDHSHDHQDLFDDEAAGEGGDAGKDVEDGHAGHGAAGGHDSHPSGFDPDAVGQSGGDLDEEAQQILAEARELTEEMYGDPGTAAEDDDSESDAEAAGESDADDAEGKDQ